MMTLVMQPRLKSSKKVEQYNAEVTEFNERRCAEFTCNKILYRWHKEPFQELLKFICWKVEQVATVL